MKQTIFTTLLTVLMSMVGAKAFAYDIAVMNNKGTTLHYNYINDMTELEVASVGPFIASENYIRQYTNVEIPEEVTYMNKTLKVTSIGDNAFRNVSCLNSIIIPNSITRIGNYAFYNCELGSVIIPNSVTSIGDYAFYHCGLSSVTIPNCVTSIGNYTFSECRKLTSVTIPNSVTSIGDNAFEGCI